MANVKAAMEYAAKIDRAAMEKRLHDPVATKNEKGITLHVGWDDLPDGTQIYTSTHQREWVGLTDEEAKQVWTQLNYDMSHGKFATDDNTRHVIVEFYQAIEAKLKEKNGG